MKPPDSHHQFRLMGATLKGKINQSVTETPELRENGSSYVICSYITDEFFNASMMETLRRRSVCKRFKADNEYFLAKYIRFARNRQNRCFGIN